MDDTRIGRFVHALARYTAIAGGVVLLVVMATTVISVIGRSLIWTRMGFRPIPGDYELVEAGVFFAVFAFLPWAHLTRANAIVAVVTDHLPVRFNVILEAIMDLLMLLVAVFLATRHFYGLMDKVAFKETTLLLRMPLWWIYAGGMVGAVVLVIVALYCLARSTAAAVSKNPTMPESGFIE
jgi:TRAP-type C4-dicarboxylate transport system permease small subunit